MRTLNELYSLLPRIKNIVITHHFNADADAIGSSLGLYHYLQTIGIQSQVITPNTLPSFLTWMPGADNIIVFEKEQAKASKLLQEAELIFCLDINTFSRTKIMTEEIAKSKAIKVMIDHHLQPQLELFDYGLSLPDKSSTCEMIYDFINTNQDNSKITLPIAKCLYAGTMTDTGSFKFSCTTASVHTMVADLIKKGLEPTFIHQAIYDTYDENRLRFLGYVLSSKMEIIPESHTAIIAISKQDMQHYELKQGDTEGIVNYPLSLKNINLSIFLSEREEEIRMSFRSKGHLDVNTLAKKYFNGGGHENAAGGRSTNTLENTISDIKKAILENQTNIVSCYNELA
ncbi:MAG: bifunctional oligoribonuclease/PAP phosphatase NrnA [Chitinophagaceae bacterium]